MIKDQELKEITGHNHRCKAILYSYLYRAEPLTAQESETVTVLNLGLKNFRARKKELENAS